MKTNDHKTTTTTTTSEPARLLLPPDRLILDVEALHRAQTGGCDFYPDVPEWMRDAEDDGKGYPVYCHQWTQYVREVTGNPSIEFHYLPVIIGEECEESDCPLTGEKLHLPVLYTPTGRWREDVQEVPFHSSEVSFERPFIGTTTGPGYQLERFKSLLRMVLTSHLLVGAHPGDVSLRAHVRDFTPYDRQSPRLLHSTDALTECYDGSLYRADTDELCYSEDFCGYFHLGDHLDVTVVEYVDRFGDPSGEYALRGDCTYSIYHDGYVRNCEVEECSYCGTSLHEDCLLDHSEDCEDREEEEEGYGDATIIHEYHSSNRGIECAVHTTDGDKEYALKYNGGSHTYTIGFEVEKTEVGGSHSEGSYVAETSLFAYWERDGSCGVEGVTNAYGIGSGDLFRQHVMASTARSHLNEDTDDSCGGHVNFRRTSMIPYQVVDVTLADIRPYAGLFYALFRNRLKVTYCANNKKLEDGSHGKYTAIRKRGGYGEGLEFRLCSRIKSPEQLLRRFELFKQLGMALDKKATFKRFVAMCAPYLREAYPDVNKRNRIRKLASHFNRFLMEGIIHPDIEEFLDGVSSNA